MEGNIKKSLLIVDDSKIDRIVLRSILEEEFEVSEAENGYTALEYIQNDSNMYDAVLLDITMPVLDGIETLRLIRNSKGNSIKVFMISSEATKDNIEQAIHYGVSDFIRKPYDKNDILTRLEGKLNIIRKHILSREELIASGEFATRLEKTYKKYLTNCNLDFEHYKRMEGVVKILLNKYSTCSEAGYLPKEQIALLSRSAFFCDIGFMMLPRKNRLMQNEEDEEEAPDHTTLGEDIVQLNTSKECEYFVQICADVCKHHHEKYDGGGFPEGLVGDHISIYAQMCRLADEFDKKYFKYKEHGESQFEFVIKEISATRGGCGKEVFNLLVDSKTNILLYYRALKQ